MGASSLPSASASRDPISWSSTSARQTQRLGECLGSLCQPHDLILLQGDLGAGKTALAQGIGAGLGVTGIINSPTFTLVKEYDAHIPLYHFDLYRLDDPAQVEELGVEDYLDRDGVCVVEWPERAMQLWPPRWLRVRLRVTGPRTRRIEVDSRGARGQRLSELLRAAYHVRNGSNTGAAHREEMA